MARLRMSKTDFERHLLAAPGWWHDPVHGVRRGKVFRDWSSSLWRAHNGMRGPSNKRIGVVEYNRRCEALKPSFEATRMPTRSGA